MYRDDADGSWVDDETHLELTTHHTYTRNGVKTSQKKKKKKTIKKDDKDKSVRVVNVEGDEKSEKDEDTQ